MFNRLKYILKSLAPFVVNDLTYKLVKKYIGNFVPIFMLHRIGTDGNNNNGHSVSQIRKYLEYMRAKRYHPISLGKYVDCISNGDDIRDKSVVFTIDDGFVEQCTLAGDIFSEYEVPLTCFVITDFIDKILWPWDDQIDYIIHETKIKRAIFEIGNWGEWALNLDNVNNKKNAINTIRNRLKKIEQTNIYDNTNKLATILEVDLPSTPPLEYQPASWIQAQYFVDKGHFIAPHTKSHRLLSKLSASESKLEIETSFERVEEKIKSAANVFAYPTGRLEDFEERDQNFIRDCGLKCAVSTISGAAFPHSNIYSLPRYALPYDMNDYIQYLTYIEVIKNIFLK